MDENILVAAPTGFIAICFRPILPEELICETVHSAFHIPVNVNERPSINRNPSHYDIIIIDEISMISESNFQHVLDTLTRLIFRPVLVVCGDYAQQQPFKKLTNRTVKFPVH
jgi:ATP-dependent exoDNAse (exonuclease V) alpha subunit